MCTPCVDAMERRWLFAVVVPAGFTDEQYASGLINPTAMEFAPDGRLFLDEEAGNLRVIDSGGNLQATPFVSLDVDSVGERGLLGIAFDPSFMNNGYVYLYYTVPNGPDGSAGAFNRVSRFTAVDADSNPANGYQPGNTAAAGSEVVLLNIDPLSTATNHNGGALHFGPDGKLYLAVGENANGSNAQSLNTLKGKILRLNSDGSAPADNPFNDHDANPAEPNDYIWAMGLRNPFTTAFDPVTGRFHINDVGENTWEEINLGQAGANYGWPTYEGPESDPNFGTPPIFAYTHSASGTDGGNIICGGTFYRPKVDAFPSQYTGDYFFEDGGRGWIKSYDISTGTADVFATGANFPVDLKTGNDGALYYLERGSGSVRRIRSSTPPAPPAWLGAGSAATWNGTTLTVTGAASIVADPGTDAPLIVGNTAAANLTINPSSGSQVNITGVSLSNGATVTLTDAAASRVLVVNAGGGLTVTGASRLNLADNALIIRGGSLAAVASLIKTGFANGAWNGAGVNSSSAAADPQGLTALGYASNADMGLTNFAGVFALAGNEILVRYTYYGDADLDGQVTLDDFSQFLNGYQMQTPATNNWLNGDFDYDGAVTLDDFSQFLYGYQNQGAPL